MRQLFYILLASMLFGSCNNSNDEHFNFPLAFELSGGMRTATYAETIEFSQAISRASQLVSYQTYGQSSQGYELPLLVLDKDGLSNPAEIREQGRLILFVEANIHPGEPDGNDAMMLLLKEFVQGQHHKLLENVSVLFAPVVNPDGLVRFGSYNRINQNGPEKMGWRTNAMNLNLNRDFVKADAPAMQAWLKLYNHWLPEFFIDCHTTDGADYQYVITYMLETFGNMDSALTHWQLEEYLPYVEAGMFDAGYPIFPYVSFRSWHDPRSGLISRPAPPMLSNGYTALKNRPGLLIETHMLKPYKERVLATKKMIALTMEQLNKTGGKLPELVAEADEFVTTDAFRQDSLTVAYESTQKHDTVDFLGVEYDVVKSDLTGGDWFQYHKNKPVTFRLPYYRYPEASQKVKLPVAYIVPPEWSDVIHRLKLHGVEMNELTAQVQLPVETYHFSNVAWRNSPSEGRMKISTLDIHKRNDTTIFPAGSMLVRTDQSAARLLAYMMEPSSTDSFLRWGFFNAIFEQKEYSETYVMEGMAREMMARDPQLRKEFEQFLQQNPEAKQSSWTQLNWFYRRTPYWDAQKNVYPIKRIVDASVLKLID
ncbi:MAG: M14 family metallopeptidase [Salinivirgaceae bacterium]